jgi:hypothetical protein
MPRQLETWRAQGLDPAPDSDARGGATRGYIKAREPHSPGCAYVVRVQAAEDSVVSADIAVRFIEEFLVLMELVFE